MSTIVIGITGPTGAGKSSLRELFEKRDFVFLDADLYARRITERGSSTLTALADTFGADILDQSGNLNRKKLSERAFSSKENTERLNSITHPAITALISEDLNSARSRGQNAVIDAPLLFESGAYKLCDVVIAVTASYEDRLKRITERDLITKEQAEMRMNSQHQNEYYESRAAYTICNEGSTEQFLRAVGELIDGVIERESSAKG
ncbi:MAG: dephospho-CoA kinase [Oscillospiraceae bacterium]|jgi:dephospho-CoA kinase|nr:dephospho-CoA kinase [Oscillospiraceae bacterium]